MIGPLGNSRGLALILTLVVLGIITAMVVEFSYGVYLNTASLYNWQSSQKLSCVAKSGVKLASTTIDDRNRQYPYTYPGKWIIAPQRPFKDVEAQVSMSIEDESSKLNLNTLVYPNGVLNDEAFRMLVRLLKALNLDPTLAERIADWMDPDQQPRLTDSEKGAKDYFLASLDELQRIPGLAGEAYEALHPYVTIYGSGSININGAEIPVLMSLADSITKEMAERIVRYRVTKPFEKPEEIVQVPGFEQMGQRLMGRIAVKGSVFRLVSTAVAGELKRVIEAVLEISGNDRMVKYWKEM